MVFTQGFGVNPSGIEGSFVVMYTFIDRSRQSIDLRDLKFL